MQFTREIRVLIIHLTRQVYKSSFENLEDELNSEGNKMKKSKYSNSEIIFEYLNGIQMECEYSNIRIFADILTFYLKNCTAKKVVSSLARVLYLLGQFWNSQPPSIGIMQKLAHL